MKKTPDQSRDRRLKILGKDEIEALYGLPRFTPEEQNLYFSLSPSEALAMVAFGLFKTRLYFILQLGYFKAQHQFYVFSTGEVQDDARYVEERYFPLIKFSASFRLSKNTRLDQQDKILELCQYRLSDQGIKQQLVIKARESAKIFSKPIYIFRELIHYLTDQRSVAPGYTFMQDTIGQALDFEEQRLIQIVQHYLTESDRQNLARLVAPSDERYEVTRLKRAPKDFSLTEIAREIERGETMKALYISAERVLPLLEISNESIKYYAQLVDYSSVFQVTQHDKALISVYLLCFIGQRFREVHDHLITALIYHVKHYGDEAKQAAKERVYEYHLEHNRNLPKAGQVLKLFTDDETPSQTPFQNVQTKAFTILEREQLDRMAIYLAQKAQFDETAFQWEHIDGMSKRFKGRLRPILKGVDWAMGSTEHPLLQTIQFLN